MKKEFLELLQCPMCGGDIACDGKEALFCEGCGRKYKISQGIPRMLPEERRNQ